MNKKASTFFKVFTGVLFVIAIFFHDMDRRIFLGLIAFGLIGLLLLLVIPQIRFPKIQGKHTFRKRKKHLILNKIRCRSSFMPVQPSDYRQITFRLSKGSMELG